MRAASPPVVYRLSFFVCCLALCQTLAHGQTWDKFLAPGFTYRMEVNTAVPRIIHAIRYSPQSKQVWAKPEVGGLKVFADEPARSRQTMSELIKQAGAIGGVNGDFFPWTGDPLGMMVRDGELVSAPWPKRAVFAWGKKGSAGGIPTLSVKGQNGSQGAIAIDGINEECGPNKVVFNSPAAGFSKSKGEAVHIVLKRVDGDFKARSKWSGTVEQVVRATQVPVPEDGAILTTTLTSGPNLGSVQLGDPISVEFQANGLDWTRFDQAIGGGPFLVRNGNLAIDWDYQGFGASFANKRHPRTAVGRTRSGDIWWVTLDGRQQISDGASLDELARIMIRYGCVEAVNLDGGGSTTFNLFGLTLNRPSDGQERPVANGVLFFGEAGKAATGTIKISGPAKLYLDTPQPIRVFTANGLPVGNANVIWQSSGSGWVDQGGLVRPTALGIVRILAWSEGRTATLEIPVVEKPKPPKKPVRKKRRR